MCAGEAAVVSLSVHSRFTNPQGRAYVHQASVPVRMAAPRYAAPTQHSLLPLSLRVVCAAVLLA